jgi:hypothetical protein
MLPQVPRSATGLYQPVAAARPPEGPGSSNEAMNAARQHPGGSEPASQDDEWESLPHLDSTMLSHPSGGGAAPAVPPIQVKKYSLSHRDQGDLPTIRPQDVPSRAAVAPPVEDPGDHTFAGELPATSGGEQFEDLPTPVKGTPSLRDMGLDPDSEFAEDTNKGDGPRGMPTPGPGGEASVELSDADFEDLL